MRRPRPSSTWFGGQALSLAARTGLDAAAAAAALPSGLAAELPGVVADAIPRFAVQRHQHLVGRRATAVFRWLHGPLLRPGDDAVRPCLLVADRRLHDRLETGAAHRTLRVGVLLSRHVGDEAATATPLPAMASATRRSGRAHTQDRTYARDRASGARLDRWDGFGRRRARRRRRSRCGRTHGHQPRRRAECRPCSRSASPDPASHVYDRLGHRQHQRRSLRPPPCSSLTWRRIQRARSPIVGTSSSTAATFLSAVAAGIVWTTELNALGVCWNGSFQTLP